MPTSKRSNNKRGARKSAVKGVQVLPVPIKRVPSSPPTIKTDIFVTRRFRHTVAAGGSSGTYVVDASTVDTDFGITTRFAVTSVTAWCLPTATNELVSLTLTDSDSTRKFSDVAQIGQPAAVAGYRFGDHARIAFHNPTDSTSPLTTIDHTTGALVVVDLVCEVLQA